MNDFEDIWKPACVKAGVWKPETVCNGFQHPGEDFTKICNDCGAITSFYGSHDIPAPALGDAGAFKAMINYLAPRYVIVKRMDAPEGQSLYQVNSSGWQPSLDLALAAAVLASKE